MKKTRYIIVLVAAMFAVGAMLFVACEKENEKSTIGDNSKEQLGNDFSLLINTNNGEVENFYEIIDVKQGLVNWRRFKNGKFAFSQDINVIPDTMINVKVIDKSTLHVDYSDGQTLDLMNIKSSEGKVTFNILSDEDTPISIAMKFPSDVDIIHLFSNEINDAKIAPPLIYGGVLLGIAIFEGIQYIVCENEKADHAKECEDKHCKAELQGSGVDCQPKPNTDYNGINCNDYDFWCN